MFLLRLVLSQILSKASFFDLPQCGYSSLNIMDAKSLAKSKRAHTQHHNKKSSHSVHKPKVPGGGGVSEKKNQTATKNPVQSRRVSGLPSNWDRYDNADEELDSGLENASTSKPVDDVSQPKSKGADYMHLLSEAQAESQSKIKIIDSDCLSSLDDLLHDEFSRIVGSMISARGDGIVSWMEDDNFVVEEDGSASYHEPEFLSLNLNALAKTLEKVDLHERLYIDVDLLPPELCHSLLEANESVQQESSGKKSESSIFEPESLDRVKDIPILTDQSEKSTAIEDDLDLLLNSFGESHNQNPCVKKSSGFEDELDSLLLNSHHSGGEESLNKPEQNPSDKKLHHTKGFDDLLDSTSVSIKPEQNQTSSSVGKSKVLDEFDSWLDTI